jgi:predicted O-methyltransferase YrrM
MKKLIGKILLNTPYLRHAYLSKHHSRFRPGHYYSPVPDVDELNERQEEIWRTKQLPGIELNEGEQKEFLDYLLKNESNFSVPHKKDVSKLYSGDMLSYPYVDGVVLHAMMAKFRPKHVIEVGSGSSSVCMIDASVQHGIGTKFTFVEPEPQYCLDNVLKQEDREKHGVTLIKKRVQEVSAESFSILKNNDILFIDSSHVSKAGSDVNYILTEILPTLNKGVIVHFHDIYYPFEYTREYLLQEKLVWNEVYSLHNFLLFNSAFKIIFFSDYMRLKTMEDRNFKTNKSSDFLADPVRPKNIWIQRM